MSETHVAVLLADLALIIVVARAMGRLAAVLGQPSVLGEILAGILLGPTLFDGAVSDALFPEPVRPHLGALASLGLVLFMFAVGLEFDFGRLRGAGRMTGITAAGSALVPFGLGLLLAWFLMRDHQPADRTAFMLFIGVVVSVTAFPVLARILSDRGLIGTWLGVVALSAAAVCDLAAWTTLAGIQALMGGARDHWQVLLAVPYVGVLVAVRPLLRRWLARGGAERGVSLGDFALLLVGALVSAAVTQWLGLHFVLGAFAFGLAVPRMRPSMQEGVVHRTRYATTLLLPVYFVTSGLKVDLSAIGGSDLLQLGVIMAVAVTGKLGGTWIAARSQGLSARGSAVLASLMNTRGLTELIALGVGLEAGLLDERLYALFVVMAVVTTGMTGPLLRLLRGRPGDPTAAPLRRGSDQGRKPGASHGPGQRGTPGPSRSPRHGPPRPAPPAPPR